MNDLLVVEGTWPDRLRITRGWARAEARPWNDESGAAQLRMMRGGADFLGEATERVVAVGGDPVYSPALYPSSTRVWIRAGYQEFDQLFVLERSLMTTWPEPRCEVEAGNPDWNALVAVDRAAFEGFWRMSRVGLEEAARATSLSMVLTVGDGPGTRGYSIVGAQRGVGYLQRIAVDPTWGGRGVGTDLVLASLGWARSRGCRTMVLNVRHHAGPARRLYQATGFHDTGTRLSIMGNQV